MVKNQESGKSLALSYNEQREYPNQRSFSQPISAIKKVTIWGNHSSTQFPDASQATCNGDKVSLEQAWLETEFVPTVQKRGAAVIAARKLSSAMSAAKVDK